MGERSQVLAEDLLSDQVCVIAGAGSGVGRASALEMARLGAKVVICGSRPEELAETEAMIAAEGGECERRELDPREEAAVEAFVAEVVERYGRIDTLVTNADDDLARGPDPSSPASEDLHAALESSVTSAWLLTHAVATKAFIPQRAGRVVAIAPSRDSAQAGRTSTNAARAAVENMIKTLSVEWARFGVTLSALAAEGSEERAVESAVAVAYLASPAADFVTGTTIQIGGRG